MTARAVPTMRTFLAGEVEVGAYLNANVRDLGNFLLGAPMFSGRLTVAQSLATGTGGVALLLDTEDIDTDGGHSTITSTTQYVIQVPGTYLVGCQVEFAANATGNRGVEVHKAAALIADARQVLPNAGAAQAHSQSSGIPTPVACVAGDIIEAAAWQNSGGNLNVTAARLVVEWVSR